MSRRRGTASTEQESVASSVQLRHALVIAGSPERATWLHKPYIERAALILLVGAEGTYKSFLALHWALSIAMTRQPVLFISAEGRGLWRRLRAWAIHHYPHQDWTTTLNASNFYAVERPLNLSSLPVIADLIREIEARELKPVLVVVDTLTRNSDGMVERSNEDVTAYLNQLDLHIRARYGCAVLLVHHVGHAARDRARGPFSLIASTDANFLVERPDSEKRVITIRSGRMKDAEPPAPFTMEAQVVEIDATDDEGNTETSLVLRMADQATVAVRRPTGKAQRQLLNELERLAAIPGDVGVWPEGELRAIGRGLGFSKSTARDAVHGLRELGYFMPTIGGSRLSHMPERGANGAKGGENTDSPRVSGGEKGARSLDLALSPHPSPPISPQKSPS